MSFQRFLSRKPFGLFCWDLFPSGIILASLLLALTLAQAVAAQSLTPAPAAVVLPPPPPPSTVVLPPKPPFLIRSYEGTEFYQCVNGATNCDVIAPKGKCLDYGTPPPASFPLPFGTPAAGLFVIGRLLQDVDALIDGLVFSQTPPSVFLNDCRNAHPIVVQELNNGRHEVILHAGNQVIGIPERETAFVATLSGSPASTPLQLLSLPTGAGPVTVNDVFALDGDSIILASSRCTVATPIVCSPPPTQLVVQLQNGQSNNGTPLVLAARNLANSEFWDFVATDGSAAVPTSGFGPPVSNATDLINQINEINAAAQPVPGDMRCYGQCTAAWGDVITIAPGAQIDLTASPAFVDATGSVPAYHNLVLPTGVTLRGDRRGTTLGPLLVGNYDGPYCTGTANDVSGCIPIDMQIGIDTAVLNSIGIWPHVITVEGDYVRVTGLRIRGPSDRTQKPQGSPEADGIEIGNGNLSAAGGPQVAGVVEFSNVLIDHNEAFNWTGNAVTPFGGYHEEEIDRTCQVFILNAVDRIHVSRNFLHNNEQDSAGYGVGPSDGVGVSIFGNVFSMNRHAIGSDISNTDQYTAWDNLVLSSAPTYGGNAQQDFDMHGTHGASDGSWIGGWAGNHIDIGWNTFLSPGNRYNFELRGEPYGLQIFGNPPMYTCNSFGSEDPDLFHNNVTQHSADGAIDQYDFNADEYKPTSSNLDLTITDNVYSAHDPTNILGVGDFDGDGIQDLFLATGTTWFYSPGGVAEWRYLSGEHAGKIQSLLLGDFDGDGRTDVATLNGSSLIVSWGGISAWQVLNLSIPAGAAISDMAVGDFNGDGRDDILYTDGMNWYISSGGRAPFIFVNSSHFSVPDLRFGHFATTCGSGKETDVFGIVSGNWEVTCGAQGDWQVLQPSPPTNSLANLYVADFDGDGNADVTQAYPLITSLMGGVAYIVNFSKDGSEGWVSNEITPSQSCPTFSFPIAAVGRFDGGSAADILFWGGDVANNVNHLCMLPVGAGDAQLQSRQDMR